MNFSQYDCEHGTLEQAEDLKQLVLQRGQAIGTRQVGPIKLEYWELYGHVYYVIDKQIYYHSPYFEFCDTLRHQNKTMNFKKIQSI